MTLAKHALRLIREALFSNILTLSSGERWRSSLGALMGVGICAFLLHAIPLNTHWLLAPVGASIVILFVQSHSPLAQPWSVIGGYLLATIVGLICVQWMPVPQVAAALAVALSIWLMARFNCIHPPGGAVALLIVLGGPQTAQHMLELAALIGLNVTVLLSSAWLVNNFVLKRRYPFSVVPIEEGRHHTKDATPINRTGLSHSDLESAITALNTFVDVQEEELVQIYNLAVAHAFGRHAGMSCADVMSRDVVTVHFDTDLEVAWNQLRFHKIKSLPVVDQFERLIGIVTVADFLRQIDDTSAAGIAGRLQGLLKRTPGPSSGKAEVVGQIMTASVFSVPPDTLLSDLVHLVAEKGLPHIPVVDPKMKVIGIVTQSDMLAALYKHIALSGAGARASPLPFP
jgi:CBS domain-containing membrane protein